MSSDTARSTSTLLQDAWRQAGSDVRTTTSLDDETLALLDVAITVSLRSSRHAIRASMASAFDRGVTVQTLGYSILQLAAYIGFVQTFDAARILDDVASERGLDASFAREIVAAESRYAYGIDHYGRLNDAALDNIRTAFDDVAGRLIDATFKSFGDTFGQSPLSLQQKQMVTVAVLAAMGGVAPQLQFHVGAARNVGVTEVQIVDVILQVQALAGMPAAYNALISAKAAFEAGDTASPGYR